MLLICPRQAEFGKAIRFCKSIQSHWLPRVEKAVFKDILLSFASGRFLVKWAFKRVQIFRSGSVDVYVDFPASLNVNA